MEIFLGKVWGVGLSIGSPGRQIEPAEWQNIMRNNGIQENKFGTTLLLNSSYNVELKEVMTSNGLDVVATPR